MAGMQRRPAVASARHREVKLQPLRWRSASTRGASTSRAAGSDDGFLDATLWRKPRRRRKMSYRGDTRNVLVNELASSASDIRAALARISDLAGALDGYPVAQLFDIGPAAGDGVVAMSSSAKAVIEHTLMQWTQSIEHDLGRLPPATTGAMLELRQRLEGARLALLEARSVLQDLSDLAQDQDGPIARPDRAVSVRSDFLA